MRVNVFLETPYGVNTKSGGLDSYVFLLLGPGGDTLQKSTVGQVTGNPLSLKEGEYTVQVYNRSFTGPAFDSPYYTARAQARVRAGEACEVNLVCTQANAGVRVTFTETFRKQYPLSRLLVQDSVGSLEYLSSVEGRWGYFFPGPVGLTLHLTEDSLLTSNKTLLPKYMYTYTVDGAGVTEKSVEPVFHLSVDSSCVAVSEPWNAAGVAGDGSSKEQAYSVAGARAAAASADTSAVWVSGFVVGQFTSKSNVITSGESLSDANVALADAAPLGTVADCLPVELAKATFKTAIGLSSNPLILNKRGWVKGVLTSYFSQTGLKNISQVVVK